MWSPWKTHWALALVKGIREPHEVKKLVRQSQVVQSVMQDCQYVSSHLLPACNLLVQGSKILTITVCQDGFKFYCGVLRWISFILNSLIRWTSKRDNFIFSTPTFVTWYFCFPRKVWNMIPLFSQKRTKEDKLTFFLLGKNEIMLLTNEKYRRGIMILFHSRGKFWYHR